MEPLLHRQINPNFIQAGRVTSQAFRPTPKDNLRLSVYDGFQIEARAAWHHYVHKLVLNSAGVLSVSSAECVQIELCTELDSNPYPEHAVIVFQTGSSNGAVEKAAKQLRHFAVARGWQYRPGQDDLPA